MGTLSFPGLALAHIEAQNICDSDFPSTDPLSLPPTRSLASFGGTQKFLTRSNRQEVRESKAVVSSGISVIGVNFEGPVNLVFHSDLEDTNELYVVDEGGFCSESNPITVRTDFGEQTMMDPFSSMRMRVFQGKCIPEVVVPLADEDGTQIRNNSDKSRTEVDVEGNWKTTFVDKLGLHTTTREILKDGTAINTVARPDSTTSTTTVLPNGTKIDAKTDAQGVVSSFTSYFDGSTVDEVKSLEQTLASFTTQVDGTTSMKLKSPSRSTETKVYTNGTVYTKQTGPKGAIIRTSTIRGSKSVTMSDKARCKYPSIGSLVNQIQSGESEEQVVKKFCKNGVTVFGLSEKWVRSVYQERFDGDDTLSSLRMKWGRLRRS